MTKEEAINTIIASGFDTNQISDGYHTFGELYDHRVQLWITLLKVLTSSRSKSSCRVWMSTKHSDGNELDGWFLLGLTFDYKQITYHVPLHRWNECNSFAEVLPLAPSWDGHTSRDVLERLSKI